MGSSRQAPGERGGGTDRRRRYIWPVWIVLASLVAAEAGAETPVDLELALAIDVSRSIDADEAQLQREGYIKAFRNPEVVQAIRAGMLRRIAVTYFEWAGMTVPDVVVGWTLIEDEASARAFVSVINRIVLERQPSTHAMLVSGILRD